MILFINYNIFATKDNNVHHANIIYMFNITNNIIRFVYNISYRRYYVISEEVEYIIKTICFNIYHLESSSFEIYHNTKIFVECLICYQEELRASMRNTNLPINFTVFTRYFPCIIHLLITSCFVVKHNGNKKLYYAIFLIF